MRLTWVPQMKQWQERPRLLYKARAALLSVSPSVFFFLLLSVLLPLKIPFSHPPTLTHTYTNARAQLWNGAARQPGRAVKTITGCQREVVQEELSFNLKNASRHKADVRGGGQVERDIRCLGRVEMKKCDGGRQN